MHYWNWIMANIVIYFFFTFLFINMCCETSSFPETHILDDSIDIANVIVKQERYKCWQCESSECGTAPDHECGDALACYKASVRASNGTVSHHRGCTTAQDHYQFTCRRQRSGVHKRVVGIHNITCCLRDLCNGGDFPELPPPQDTTDATTDPPPSLDKAIVLLSSNATIIVYDKPVPN